MDKTACIALPGLMDQLAVRVELETGLAFPPAKRRQLQGALRKMAESKQFGNDELCIEWLLAQPWDKEKADLCAHHLTIGETYFFREPRAFELLCDYARQKIKNGGKPHPPLRMWSAGCCTGEEPYSMAMALRQSVPELEPERLSILATDLNARNLALAREGVYRQWSFRKTDPQLQKLHFREAGPNVFRIRAHLKEQVTFAELNLALPSYPSIATNTHAMDIIFCRNVLMYFSRPQMKKVIERFRQCLVEGGWLVVNPSEASAELFAGFSGFYYPDAIYFQKNSSPDVLYPRLPGARAERRSTHPATPIVVARTNPAAPAVLVAAPPAPPVRRAAANAERKSEPRQEAGVLQGDPVRRAQAMARDGALDDAMRSLEQAIVAAPLAAELYHAKALLAMEGGDHRLAMQSLKKLLYLKPDFILAHYLCAILQSAQGKRAEATRQFEASAELLAQLGDNELVPGSDGLSAAVLRESVHAYLTKVQA